MNRSKPLYFEHEDNAALMDGKWKLVGSKVSVPGGPDEKNWELYDIEADRSETKNLSKSRPEVLGRLSKDWVAWANDVGVFPKPAKRSTE